VLVEADSDAVPEVLCPLARAPFGVAIDALDHFLVITPVRIRPQRKKLEPQAVGVRDLLPIAQFTP
jgi:hypothetical protein